MRIAFHPANRRMVIPFVLLATVFGCLLWLSIAARSQTLTSRRVLGQSFVANLWLPAAKDRSAGVLVVGGSGGGIAWQDYWGEILSRQGLSALALAYFGMEGLPKELDEIPLEYCLSALEYMQRQSEIDPTRIGVLGVSKGGELALLLASEAPAIRAVVAFVPSSVVFQSGVSMEAGQKPRSSWTLHGRPLPFVPREAGGAEEPLVNEFRRALRQRDHVAKATIPVEKIHGPILLLSGKDDTTWPATSMSEMIIARLRSRKFQFSYEHIAYDDAGHMIHQIRSDAVKRGGTEIGNSVAQQDAQRRTLAFLARTLGAAGDKSR